MEAVSDSFVHVVKKGESLGSIARKHHVTVANIKRWNRLKRDSIRPGQRLTIYRSGAPMAQVSKPSKSSKAATTGPTVKVHTVKRGETLTSIAKKYRCSVNDIKKWNGIKSNNIKVGQKLKIKK